jgi:hypothetical protein
MVGAEPVTLAHFLQSLRAAFGMRPARVLSVPQSLMAAAARVGDRLATSFLTRETLSMLERGNVGDAGPLTRLLGRPPLAVSAFIDPAGQSAARREALFGWMAPLLRWSVAFMWIIAGIVSLGPRSADGLELLRQLGASATLAPLLLMGAAISNIALGILTLSPRRKPLLWTAQILLVLVYTAIISVFLPELWLEPFGPVAKNVPILMMLLLLRQIEEHR